MEASDELGRDARAARGPPDGRPRRAVRVPPRAADRGQLEDAQDRGRGRGATSRRCCPASRPSAGRDRDLRALHRSARDGRQRPRLARGGVRAEHAPRARGAFTGEISAPMLAELGVARRRARPLRAPRAVRRDRPGARAEAARRAGRRPAPDPVRRRERVRARRGRHRAQAAPADQGRPRGRPRRAAGRGRRSPTSRSGRSAPARSPPPSRPRRRSRSSARWSATGSGRPPRASACGSSTAARSTPTTPPSCSRCPTSTARSSAGPRWRPRASLEIVDCRPRDAAARAVRLPGRARRLGPRGSRARATPSRWPAHPSSTASGSGYPHTTLTASGRAVGLPEGQMGNSEVGHLNLGAGVDRAPGPDAHRRRRARRACSSENPAIGRALTGAERVHLIGLVSDGGVHSSLGPPPGAASSSPAGSASAELVIHCFTDGRDTLPGSGVEHVALRGTLVPGAVARRSQPARRASRASSAATTRWIATAAGSASRPPMTCSCTAAPSTSAETRRRGRAGRLRARRDRRVHHRRPPSATRAASAPATASCASTSAPTACARSPAPWPSPASARTARSCPAGAAATGSGRSSSYTTLTEYEEDWDYPVAFPPERPAVDARRRARCRGSAPAARGRDREVRARDLLLQRRRGGPLRRAKRASWRPRRATSPPTTTSPR